MSSKELDERRLLVALDAARDGVAARDRDRGPVFTTISAARARGSVQTSHDASESARMRVVIGWPSRLTKYSTDRIRNRLWETLMFSLARLKKQGGPAPISVDRYLAWLLTLE
jgi:hypothetical protein